VNDQFTAQFRQPNDAVQRHVLGDEGKAVGRVPPTALLFEPRGALVFFHMDLLEVPNLRISHKTVANGVDAPSPEL